MRHCRNFLSVLTPNQSQQFTRKNETFFDQRIPSTWDWLHHYLIIPSLQPYTVNMAIWERNSEILDNITGSNGPIPTQARSIVFERGQSHPKKLTCQKMCSFSYFTSIFHMVWKKWGRGVKSLIIPFLMCKFYKKKNLLWQKVGWGACSLPHPPSPCLLMLRACNAGELFCAR